MIGEGAGLRIGRQEKFLNREFANVWKRFSCKIRVSFRALYQYPISRTHPHTAQQHANYFTTRYTLAPHWIQEFEAGRFILKFPHVFEVFEHPIQHILYCRLNWKVISQMGQEGEALLQGLPDAVTRMRKLLMSNTGRIRLEHIRIAGREFGLRDDFEYSVILNYTQFLRLLDADETRTKQIELVEKDSSLAVCEIERVRDGYREKGMDAEDMRFAFLVNFPPGFKIGKYYKIAVWKWQRLPYWSPYEDISGYDLRSLEAQKRMEK